MNELSAGDCDWGATFMVDGAPERRRARMFANGELRLVLLHLIGSQDRHGYQLIKGIENLAGCGYVPSPGAVYPTLSLMVDEGVIKGAAPDGMRKIFAATSEGLAELAVRADEVEMLLAKLSATSNAQPETAQPELYRATSNLGTVLRNRARTGQLDSHSVITIVDIIDKTAKRIERL